MRLAECFYKKSAVSYTEAAIKAQRMNTLTMHPKLIGKAYDEITHLWNPDRFNAQNGIAQHQRALTFVDSRGKALDVGCGCNRRVLDYLDNEGFKYEGLDVSEKTIKLARQQHPEVVFYHEDICEWEITQKYDFITAWDSLWHIPLNEHQHVISKLLSALNPSGVLIFSFGGLEEPDEHTNQLMGPTVYYSTLGTFAYLRLVTELGGIIRHFEFDQYPEPHAYIVLQRTA